METDLYALRRVVIAGDDDLATFAARVSGVTWSSGRVRAAFGRRGDPTQPATRRAEPRAQDEAGLVQMKKPSTGSIP